LAQFGEPSVGNRRQLVRLSGERGKRLVDALAQGGDLPLTGAAEFVEPLEPFDECVELALRFATDPADLVRDIFGRGRDYGQAVAQLIHVFQRGNADACDGIYLFTVTVDQGLEAFGMLRYALACAAT
jgi:hypothetical protein